MNSHKALRSIISMSLAFAVGVAAAQNGKPLTDSQRQANVDAVMKAMAKAKADATLHVGDPAPAVKFDWVKGHASTNFNDGKVHVMEFWATWCGPCRASMPDLSDLARKYKGKVEFTSVSVWEDSHTKNKDVPYEGVVREFVDHAGPMMDYPVGMDGADNFMADHWLKASGTMGIPAAFVIDTHGKIAWIDAPFKGLDEALSLTLEDKLDAAACAQINDRYRAGMAQREKFMSEADEALKAGRADDALKAAQQAADAVPVFAYGLWSTVYRAHALKGKDEARAYLDEILRTHSNAPIALYILGETVIKDDPTSAVRVLETAMRCSKPTEPFIDMTLAKAYAQCGDYSRAVEVQQRAIAGLNDPMIDDYKSMVEPQSKILDDYRQKMNK